MIRNVHHTCIGWMLIAAAGCMAVSFAMHTILPSKAPMARAARILHAFAWASLGLWILQMSFLFYLFRNVSPWDRYGLWEMGYAPSAGPGHHWEETLFYLGVNLYATAVWVIYNMLMLLPVEQQPPTRSTISASKAG